MPAEPQWALELLRISQALLAALIGGALVLLGGWLTDRRKERTEHHARQRREKALLTGMFAVRNHVMDRLNDYEQSGLLSQLEPLRTAQAYMHRIIDKAPGESESLMIVVIETGLKLDALISAVDQAKQSSLTSQLEFAAAISRNVEELVQSLEQFDVVAQSELIILSDENFASLKQEPDQSSRDEN